jgi:hypothetical protein
MAEGEGREKKAVPESTSCIIITLRVKPGEVTEIQDGEGRRGRRREERGRRRKEEGGGERK